MRWLIIIISQLFFYASTLAQSPIAQVNVDVFALSDAHSWSRDYVPAIPLGGSVRIPIAEPIFVEAHASYVYRKYKTHGVGLSGVLTIEDVTRSFNSGISLFFDPGDSYYMNRVQLLVGAGFEYTRGQNTALRLTDTTFNASDLQDLRATTSFIGPTLPVVLSLWITKRVRFEARTQLRCGLENEIRDSYESGTSEQTGSSTYRGLGFSFSPLWIRVGYLFLKD